MIEILRLLHLLNVFGFLLAFIALFIYWIALFFIRQSPNSIKLLSMNFCTVSGFNCIFWMFYYLMIEFAPKLLLDDAHCTYLYYGQSLCTCQVTYSFTVISLNRYLIITQPTNRLFHSCRWIMTCILCQWLIGLLLPLPLLARNLQVSKTMDSSLCHHDAGLLFSIISACFQKCTVPLWVMVYERIVAITVPSLMSFFIYLLIFKYLRTSTDRIKNQVHTARIRIPDMRSRQRDLHVLCHTISIYVVFIVSWTPIALLYVIDHRRVVSLAVYASLHLFAVLFSLIIIIHLMVLNTDVKNYLISKLSCCSRC